MRRSAVLRTIFLLLALAMLLMLLNTIRLLYTPDRAAKHLPRSGDFFPIPAAALIQPLGEIPDNPATLRSKSQDLQDSYPAGRGLALGGIGAGSFMYNQAGTFGPWEFHNSAHEERILSEAAFHVREQVEGQSATVFTLATSHPLGSVLPAWHTLSPGDGNYAALYPFGWTTYTPFASDISMRFWSPIVAKEDMRTSMPVAYFDVRIANHTGKNDSLMVMFTFPNAPLCVSSSWPCTRTGFASQVQHDSTSGVTGVTLSASDPANVVDAQNTEWTIAARPRSGQSLSYTTSWNIKGDGSDIYHRFVSTGNLGNGALDTSHSAGAVAVSVRLHPQEVTTISFVLAWDFPEVLFGSPNSQHTCWMKRYTSYFGAKETATNDYVPGSYPFHQGFSISNRALTGEDAALTAVTSWWDSIANETTYPIWLRQAALNELYYDTFGSSFWESGLVENTFPLTRAGPRIGSQVPGTHLFFNIEAPIYRFAESYDVRAYYNRQWLLLFPNIERDVQRAWTQFIMADPAGHAPHDAGLLDTSPYLIRPGGTYGNPQSWLDLPLKYLFQVWEYIHFTGDESFLEYAYPAMLRSYQFVASRIPYGHYLPVDNGVDNTYDSWGLHGTTSYIGGLWILGQEIMLVGTQQAHKIGVSSASQRLINQLATNLPKSRAEYEQALWNPKRNYYQISTQDQEYGSGVMADAMFAQHVAEVLDLPDIVGNLNHLHIHLLTSYDYLVQPWHDTQGRGIGAANGVNADYSLIQTGGNEAREVWIGVSYFYAATQYLDGVRFHDSALCKNALATAHGVAEQTYTVERNGYMFDTPEAWTITDVTKYRALQYMRARAIWELLLAMKQPFPWSRGKTSSTIGV